MIKRPGNLSITTKERVRRGRDHVVEAVLVERVIGEWGRWEVEIGWILWRRTKRRHQRRRKRRRRRGTRVCKWALYTGFEGEVRFFRNLLVRIRFKNRFSVDNSPFFQIVFIMPSPAPIIALFPSKLSIGSLERDVDFDPKVRCL